MRPKNPWIKNKIDAIVKPIDDLEKERRLHLAQMTICVYGFDVVTFKKTLQTEFEKRGATMEYVDIDTGFLWSSSIREPFVSENNSLFGCDQLVVKTPGSLCDEILWSSREQKSFEVLFYTSREIKGYADQCLYWR